MHSLDEGNPIFFRGADIICGLFLSPKFRTHLQVSVSFCKKCKNPKIFGVPLKFTAAPLKFLAAPQGAAAHRLPDTALESRLRL